MTTELKRRPPPREQSLAKRIEYEEGEVSLLLHQYDWELLTSWPKVVDCRLAIEAIVSSALNPEWPLFEATHGWIAEHTDNRLLLACALEEASTTVDRRNQVLEHIVDRYGIEMPEPARDIWAATRGGKHFSWDEICAACGVENWKNPPSQSVALNDACRRVMPNPPNKEVLFARGLAMLGESTFVRLPYVQYQLVLVAMRPGGEGILEAIQQNFPPFWRAVTAVLIDPPRWMLGVERKEFVPRFYLLAETLAQGLEDMSEATRQAAINQLLNAPQCPWLWNIADKLTSHTTSWGMVSIFLAYTILNKPSWPQHDRDEVIMWDRFRDYVESLPNIIHRLPDGVKVELVRTVLTDYEEHPFKNPWKMVGNIFAELIKENPELYAAALEPIASSGRMPLLALMTYIEGVGIDLAREGLAGWLQHDHRYGPVRYSAELKELLSSYIIPKGLAAGKLIRDPEDAEELLRLDYELKPEDAADDQVIKRILFRESSSSYDSKYLPSPVWHNEAWREVLLDHANNHEAVLRSALVFAENQKTSEGLKWVATHLQPRLESRPGLRKCLNKIAWGTDYPQLGGDTGARIILATQPEWLDEEDLASAKAYCAAKWYHLKAWLAEAVLLPEEQRQIFFNHAIEDSKITNFFPSPGNWERAFLDDQARDQLAVWLLKKERRISTSDWLVWVVHFGLYPLPQFQRRIRRLLEHFRGEDLTAVLTLLEPETI